VWHLAFRTAKRDIPIIAESITYKRNKTKRKKMSRAFDTAILPIRGIEKGRFLL
jgi:hypothetical protein